MLGSVAAPTVIVATAMLHEICIVVSRTVPAGAPAATHGIASPAPTKYDTPEHGDAGFRSAQVGAVYVPHDVP